MDSTDTWITLQAELDARVDAAIARGHLTAADRAVETRWVDGHRVQVSVAAVLEDRHLQDWSEGSQDTGDTELWAS